MRLRATLLCLAGLTIPLLVHAATIRVPADQPTIQAGINVAFPGDTVLVAPGTYTGMGNKNLNLMGKAVRLASEQGAGATIIDCEFQGRGAYFINDESASTIIDGLTVRNGSVSGDFPESWGGGVLCLSSSPTISNCVIMGNSANGFFGRGGGIGLFDSSPILSNCIITQNHASQGQGGGIHCQASSSPAVIDCTISMNSATTGGGVNAVLGSSPSLDGLVESNNASFGGGVFVDATSTMSVSECSFTNNVGGGDGGAIYSSGATIALSGGATFNGNSANLGQGIFVASASNVSLGGLSFIGHLGSGGAVFVGSDSVTIAECTFEGNVRAISCGGFTAPMITDCFFDGNSEAVYCSNAAPLLMRCVLASNGYAIRSAGVQGLPRAESCTMFGNSEAVRIEQGGVTIDKTIIALSQGAAVVCDAGTATLSCTDLYANLGGDWTGCVAGQQGSNGNFTANPRFCDPFVGDFTLNALSLCAPGNSPAGCDLIGALPVACGVTDVADSPPVADVRLTVSPNPVRGSARFEVGPGVTLRELGIFDSQGRLVEQLSGADGNWEWTPRSVPAGIYFAMPEGSAVGTEPLKFLYLK